MNTVIMFPDYGGCAVDFVREVRAQNPDAILISIVNGVGDDWEIPREYADNGVMICRSEKIGLRAVLMNGYEHVTEFHKNDLIIRMDNTEHPIPHIKTIRQYLEWRDTKMVVGDLEFVSDVTLTYGSLDELAHLVILPAIYGNLTHGTLPLSCAHGFQGFVSGEVCGHAFEAAKCIFNEVDKIVAEAEKPSWGFDGAMAIGAFAYGLRPVCARVCAEMLRNRSEERVLAQIRAQCLWRVEHGEHFHKSTGSKAILRFVCLKKAVMHRLFLWTRVDFSSIMDKCGY